MWATNLRGRSKTYSNFFQFFLNFYHKKWKYSKIVKIGSESKGIKGYDKKGNKPDRTYKK